MSKLKVFTAFSGYDSQMVALKNRLKLDCDLVGWSEIDQYAIQAHDALFPEYAKRNFGDITKINWNKVPDFDLFTYSFPCTDISIAGNQQGFDKNSNTRSSLLWECEKAIKNKKPEYLLCENVKAITFKKNEKNLNKWKKTLEKLGYTNYQMVLNAKDFGVPQNRERFFLVSTLNNKVKFTAPNGGGSNYKTSLFLDKRVDFDKYEIKEPGLLKKFYDSKLVYKKPQFLNPKFDDNYRLIEYRESSICNTLLSANAGHFTRIVFDKNKFRRITPAEAFRLMGLNESEINKILSINLSKAQVYQLAGNSIVVNVLEAIFKEMFKKYKTYQLGMIEENNDEEFSPYRKPGESKEDYKLRFFNYLVENTVPFRNIPYTFNNYMFDFGNENECNTPKGPVIIDIKQFEKIDERLRNHYFGLIKPTLQNPLLIIDDNGTDIFVKSFVDKKTKKTIFACVARNIDGEFTLRSAHKKELNNILNKIRQNNVTPIKENLGNQLSASDKAAGDYIVLRVGVPYHYAKLQKKSKSKKYLGEIFDLDNKQIVFELKQEIKKLRLINKKLRSQ